MSEIRERFVIDPRPAQLGGGWHLRLIGRDTEDGQEIELGRGIFPDYPNAYNEAEETGQDWLNAAITQHQEGENV
jgi:hypothetical protein